MKRTLRFWGRFAGECLQTVLLILAILLLLTLGGASQLDSLLLFQTLPLYLCTSAALCLLMVGSGVHALYLPLLVSMGETRRSALLGYYLYQAAVVIATVGLCGLLWGLFPGGGAERLRSLPATLCLLAAAGSIGSFTGALFTRWKWIGVGLMVLISAGIGGSVAFLTVMARDNFSLTDSVQQLLQMALQRFWPLAAVSAGLVVLDILAHWLLLRRLEVRL